MVHGVPNYGAQLRVVRGELVPALGELRDQFGVQRLMAAAAAGLLEERHLLRRELCHLPGPREARTWPGPQCSG
jgi:hypothetical protein